MAREKDTYLNRSGLEYYHQKIKGYFATKTELSGKQDKLTPGSGISIINNVISIEDNFIIDCGTSTTVI